MPNEKINIVPKIPPMQLIIIQQSVFSRMLFLCFFTIKDPVEFSSGAWEVVHIQIHQRDLNCEGGWGNTSYPTSGTSCWMICLNHPTQNIVERGLLFWPCHIFPVFNLCYVK